MIIDEIEPLARVSQLAKCIGLKSLEQNGFKVHAVYYTKPQIAMKVLKNKLYNFR